MRKCSTSCLFVFLSLILQQRLAAQQNMEKLFLVIKDLSISDPDEAQVRLQKYIRAGIEKKDEKIAAKSYYLLGRINYYKSRNFISNKYYALALSSPYAKNDLSFAESCYNNLGVGYELQNLFPEALKAYQKSLQLAEQLNDSASIGQTWINIGLLNARIGKFQKARELTLTALNFFSKEKDIFNMALCYQNLGYIMSEQKRFEEAIQYYHKCLSLHQEAGNEFEIVNILFNLGVNYSDINNAAETKKYLQQTVEMALIQNRTDIVARVYVEVAENYIKANNYKLAESNLQEAMRLKGDNSYEHLILQAFTKLYAKSGNYEAYKKILQKTRELEKQRSQDEMLARTDELQAFYDFQGNVRQINTQARHIKSRRTQTFILATVCIFLAFVLIFAVFQYIKVRKYMRSLFDNKVQKTLHETLAIGTPEHQAGKHYLKDVYDQTIRRLDDLPQNKDLTVVSLSKDLGLREEHISQAVRAFGKNDNHHIFFQTFFIDELCKQMIDRGKKIPLKPQIEHSPFNTPADFTKKFREMTGLKPNQFLNYCEARLKGKLR